jgi:hypothetical protein
MMDHIAQAAIMLFGGLGVWLVGSRDPNVRKWGYLSALAGEPFWLYSAIVAGQWGVIIMGAIYTAGWARAIKSHWFGAAPNAS